MAARRLRVCPIGHEWSYLDHADLCPVCVNKGGRAFSKFLLRAGRRGGKTRIGALSMIEELAPANLLWWACAPTYPKLNDYVLPAFFKQMPAAWLEHPATDWSESELTLTLPHKTMVQFRSLEDPDRGRGPGLNGLWIDEICELTEKHWDTISPALADQSGIFFATTSPKGPDWVHKRFYLPAQLGTPGYWACHFTTLDNPWMSQTAQKAYVAEQKESMTDLMFRQEYMAEVVSFSGAIFGDILDPCVIEGTDEEMRQYFPEWPKIDTSRDAITGIDPGTDHPFAGIQLVQSPRGLVAVGEYMAPRTPFAVHAEHIKALRRGFQCRIAIDRSQAQAQIELVQYGLYTVPAENNVQAGINRLSAWMLKNRRRQVTELPTGLVLPRRLVPQLIAQLQSYRWAENTKDEGYGEKKATEQVYKKDDDLIDALRYAVMLYPVLPEADPAAATGRRDLTALPAKVRLEIERERRSYTTSEDLQEVNLEPVVEGMGEFGY